MTTTCVYLHHQGSTVFYVGCGTLARAHETRDRSQLWLDYVRLHGDYEVTVILETDDRQAALALEKRLIQGLLPLANVHWNGALHAVRRKREREEREIWYQQHMRGRHRNTPRAS